MKIAVFGATGMIGQRILKEALDRGHRVTVVARNPASVSVSHPSLRVTVGDVLNPASVASAVAGHDAVLSAYGPGAGDAQQIVAAARSLVEGARRSNVKRLITVGGAGSLEVSPGVQLLDTPDFPAAWRPLALAHRDALAVYRTADLDWTNVSPAALIQPGERTGRYRTDTVRLIVNESGESRISAEDYAVALLDEAERPRFVRKRFTVGY